jgi:hypothetical protein
MKGVITNSQEYNAIRPSDQTSISPSDHRQDQRRNLPRSRRHCLVGSSPSESPPPPLRREEEECGATPLLREDEERRHLQSAAAFGAPGTERSRHRRRLSGEKERTGEPRRCFGERNKERRRLPRRSATAASDLFLRKERCSPF